LGAPRWNNRATMQEMLPQNRLRRAFEDTLDGDY
jgi:hypothetical protein